MSRRGPLQNGMTITAVIAPLIDFARLNTKVAARDVSVNSIVRDLSDGVSK